MEHLLLDHAKPLHKPAAYPGIDMVRGLQLWQDLPAYQKFLYKFADRHAPSMPLIEARMAAGDPAAAQATVHALAGSAAHLALTDTAHHARVAEELLAAKLDAAAALAQLGTALRLALASIERLRSAQTLPEPVYAEPAAMAPWSAGAAALPARLSELLQALNSDSPEPVEPLLAALSGKLPGPWLAALADCVENFDFRGAEARVRQLVAEMDSSKEGIRS